MFSGDFELALDSFNKSNYIKANELFIKACDDGNLVACNNLGVIYEKGLGLNQDYYKAINFIKSL